jgi:hypothetical protein
MRTSPYDEAPGRGQAFEGSMETVRWTANVTPVPRNDSAVKSPEPVESEGQQVLFLRREYGLSAHLARVVAELHFGGPGQ